MKRTKLTRFRAVAKKCSHPGCESKAIAGGVCGTHGGRKKCSHPGCESASRLGGFCKKYGVSKKCNHPGCKNDVWARGGL